MSSTIGQLTSGVHQVAARYRAEDRSKPAGQETAEVGVAPQRGDRVQLSGQALVASVRHEANREILSQFARAPAKVGMDNDVNALVTSSLEQLASESGQEIAAMFEDLGIDLSETVGIDHSANATSDRIADASTAMFATFAEQNSELEGEELISAFETTLHDAVDAGYGEAREMLDGLGVEDSVISLGEETMNLVHEKFDSFFADLRAQGEAA